MKILEHNVETGEIKERNATAAELAQAKIDANATVDKLAAEEARAIAKAHLLERLGITEEEAKLLLG